MKITCGTSRQGLESGGVQRTSAIHRRNRRFPDGVIGNTTDFGSVILRSSRSRGIKPRKDLQRFSTTPLDDIRRRFSFSEALFKLERQRGLSFIQGCTPLSNFSHDTRDDRMTFTFQPCETQTY
ncbi:MAG: hypothetical protein JWM11_2502 [Planctomycetaceae bacterium]|nr:hypothetical protein [Planctomycetaceae bacterium]